MTRLVQPITILEAPSIGAIRGLRQNRPLKKHRLQGEMSINRAQVSCQPTKDNVTVLSLAKWLSMQT